MQLLDQYNYLAVVVLMMLGLWTMIESRNLVKKLVGLNILQTSVFIFYVSIGKVAGGTSPVLTGEHDVYSNPLPQVLILTAIVVGVATSSVGLALAVRIYHAFGAVEEDEIETAIETEDGA